MSKLSTLVVGLYVFILYSHLCVSGYSVVGWKRCTTSATAGHLMQSAHPQSYKPSPALSRLLLQPQRCSGYLCTDKTARSARRDLSTRSSSSVLFFTKGDEGKNIPTTTVNVNVSLQQKLFQFNKSDSEVKKYITPLLVIGAVVGLTSALGQHVPINQLLEDTVNQIAGLGPYGYLYFSLVYIVAELLAIPAMPLTASSGYLFGLLPGTLVVLFSATIAAGISFFIGRTFLRSFAQEFIQKSDKWRAVDKAIAKEGFKVILLLRLSPLLPFALSNYLYAVTSVDFA